MTVSKIVVATDNDAVTPSCAIRAKGDALTLAGQTLITSGITSSAVGGAINIRAIYMKKKKATGWEFEAVAYGSIGAMVADGWSLAAAGKVGNRSFDLTGGGGAVGSKELYCKVESGVTIGWKQGGKVYAKVPQVARDHFGQTATPANPKEVSREGNFFVFATDWNGIPKGTLLNKEALKARVRYAAPTDTSSGVYHSYCQENPPVIP